MLRKLFAAVCFLICLSVYADRQADLLKMKDVLRQEGLAHLNDGETLVAYKGYPVRIMCLEDSITHIGLNLFNQDLKQIVDEDLLGYIERDLLLQVMNVRPYYDSIIEFKIGNISDIKSVDINTDCYISNLDSNLLAVEWNLGKGKRILLYVPYNYEVFHEGTREEIEKDFIAKLKNGNLQRNVSADINPEFLQPYGETDYILPGPYYINEQITRNMYLTSTADLYPVWDKDKPIESISNLFICNAGNADIMVDLTVFKHEYGQKEQIVTSIGNLIALAELEGCIPFWGLEDMNDGTMSGSLFLYNPKQGYDHVLKIDCIPEEIIDGQGRLAAKAYLYIPSNNISSLDQPYRIKTEDEKIKYWDN